VPTIIMKVSLHLQRMKDLVEDNHPLTPVQGSGPITQTHIDMFDRVFAYCQLLFIGLPVDNPYEIQRVIDYAESQGD